MISFALFQSFTWFFIILGWIGTLIISVASITEIYKMFKGAK
ncbi:hypothetical protein ACLIBH_12685 [Virgibacillus sp. W0430]